MTTTPPKPTVKAYSDSNPCPRVELVVTPMPSDASTVTVWRQWGGRRDAVRGAKNAATAGDFLVIDYEVPLGEDVVYTVSTADVTGTPSEVSAASAVVNLGSPYAWVQDPLDPLSALPVSLSGGTDGSALGGGSFASFAYERDLSVFTPTGRRNAIGVGGLLRTASGIPLEVYTPTASDSSDFEALLTQAFPLCVRANLDFLPGLVYLAAGSVTRTPLRGGGDVWAMTGDSVAAPGLPVIVATRTWDDVQSEATTWDQLLSVYPTWTALQRGNTSSSATSIS